jgi:hypothetical protein
MDFGLIPVHPKTVLDMFAVDQFVASMTTALPSILVRIRKKVLRDNSTSGHFTVRISRRDLDTDAKNQSTV